MLCGTEPNTVGGLAHWIQTVYGESSSSDDTMWAACSSQNTNVPCESEKREKKWVFHRDNLVNTVTAQREDTCVFTKVLALSSLITTGGHIWFECKFNVALTVMTKRTPDSRRKLQSRSTNKMWEKKWKTGEGEQRGAEMIQLCWSSRLQTQTRVR